MPNVNILCGAARSGKSTEMRRRYVDAVEQHGSQSVVFLTPTERQCATQRRLILTETNLRGLWQPHIHTFETLAQTLLEANGASQPELPLMTQRTLLRQVVERLARLDALSFFRSVYTFPGFLNTLQDFIRRTKRRGVTPDATASHLPDVQRQELIRIYEDYQALLKQHDVCDADDRLPHARALLQRGQHAPFDAVRVLLLDGFISLATVEWDIVECLAESAEEVWLTLTDERDSKRARLFAHAQSVRWTPELVREIQPSSPQQVEASVAPTLTHLAQSLFRDDLATKPPTDDAVQLIEAPGQFREVEEIAREVKRLLVVGEAAPDDIALLFRNLPDYAHIVEEVFASFGIPVWLSVSESLLRSPAIQTVLTMLQIVADDFQREDVVKFLKSNYVDFDGEGEAPAEPLVAVTMGAAGAVGRLASAPSQHFTPDDLDLVVRCARITAGKGSWLRRLQAWERQTIYRLERLEQGEPLEDFEESQTRLRQELEQTRCALRFMETFFETLAPLSRAKTRAQFVTAVRQLMETFHISERLALDAQSAGAQVAADLTFSGGGHFASDDIGAFEQLQRALEDLRFAETFLEADRTPQLVGGVHPEQVRASITLSEFLRELHTALSLTTLPVPDSPEGRVAATNVTDAAGLSFPYVFIAGLVEKEFPRSQNVNPLSPDVTDSAEDFLFYTAVTRATKRLYLSHPTTDAEGRAVLTSYYVDEVRKCFASDLTVCSRARLSAVVPELSRVCNQRELLDAALYYHPSSLIPHPSPLTTHALHAAEVERHRLSREEFNHFDGVLSDAAILNNLASRFSLQHRFSAQQFNTYGQCPIKFFFRYVLDLMPLDEPTEEVEALERGQIVHEILRRFFPSLHTQTGGTAVTPQNLDAAKNIMAAVVNAYFAEQVEQGRVGDERLWEIEKAHVLRDLMLLLRHEVAFAEAGHEPHFFEEAYGIRQRTPLVIGSGAEQVLVQGKIDRIDLLPTSPTPLLAKEGKGEVGATRFAVFDYKTGGTRRWRDVLDGTDFQLPLYALAAEQVVLQGMNARCAEWSYYKVRRPIKPDDARVADEERMSECLEATQRFLPQYAADIRRGQFPVAPRADICSFCEYRHICRIDSERRIKRKV